MKFFLNGEWQGRDECIEVINPFDGSVIETVPRASAQDVDLALAAAVEGAKIMAATTGYERFEILRRASDLLREQMDDLAWTLSSEEGKVLGEARFEIDRAIQTMEISGEEAKRLAAKFCLWTGARMFEASSV